MLAKKLSDLEEKLASVSDHIFSGDNQYVEFSQDRHELKWSIPNRRWKESVDNPIYSQIKHMGIVDLLKFVQQKTGFLDAFSHISANHDVLSINHDDLIACVLANGTNYGLYKMANISDRS
ncbi:Tn3 family transposase, partial [Vibrio parahaemolyticus]